MSGKDAPIFPNTKLGENELRLRKARKGKTFIIREPNLDAPLPMPDVCGVTCQCGSTRVYSFKTESAIFQNGYACFDCWRQWRTM